MTQTRHGVVKVLETVVIPSKTNIGRINLPFSMQYKPISVVALDGSGEFKEWAHRSGNSAYASAPPSWVGKQVRVEILESELDLKLDFS